MLLQEHPVTENLDYEAVGLMAGLEVHQQLLTREKLFCRCPAGLYVESHDAEVLRHMRPTLSELGEYDGTALMEFKTKKEIVYLLNHLNVCTYEMDDTPPFPLNEKALDVAIELSLMMHMDIIDEVHISRKQYLDGSIPTGFQRTAIVGVNGFLPFKGRRLTLTHLSLEEDACREVSDKGHRIVFRTDRLGMPLTETVTAPELRTPEEVRDAIWLCGLVARSTGHVRTGIGAARQDINVSVRGGTRVEIKGVSRAGAAIKLVHNEALRQINLLRLRDRLHELGMASPEHIQMRYAPVTDIFARSEFRLLQQACARGDCVFAVCVRGVGGLAQHLTQPNTPFLSELAGRVRVIACLDEPPVLLDGAQLPEFPGMHGVHQRVRKRLRAGPQDGLCIVWGKERDCCTAAEEIRIRWGEATAGVPAETRQALGDGHTSFERILPGPDRMYPDTDLPPTRVSDDRVAAIRAKLTPPPWEREHRYASWGVPAETTRFLLRRGGAELVDAVVRETGVNGLKAAVEIGQRAKALRRKGIPTQRLGVEQWVAIFKLFADGHIPSEGIAMVAARMAQEPDLSADAARVACGIELQASPTWQAEIQRLLPELRGNCNNAGPSCRQLRHAVGRAMTSLRGRAPAKEVVAVLTEELTEVAS